MSLDIAKQSRRLIIDCVVEFPLEMTPELIAGIIRDYMHLCRFVVIPSEVSIYPKQTRIVQQAISLVGNLNDIKQ